MLYFTILPYDLREYLLQHFWISQLNDIITNIDSFHYLINNNRFWKDAYTSHFDDKFKERKSKRRHPDFKNLCLDTAKKLNDTQLTGRNNFLDRAIIEKCYNTIPFILDWKNFERWSRIARSYNEQPRFEVHWAEGVSLLREKRFDLIDLFIHEDLICSNYVSFVVRYKECDETVEFLQYINEKYPDYIKNFATTDRFYSYFSEKYNFSTRIMVSIVEAIKSIILYQYRGLHVNEVKLFRYLISMDGDRSVIPQEWCLRFGL